MKRIFLLTLFFLHTAITFGQTRNPEDDGRKIKIPVVFHVLYATKEQNIDKSLIESELFDLNQDFSQQNDMSLLDKEFGKVIGKPNIEFYLLDSIFQSGELKGV